MMRSALSIAFVCAFTSLAMAHWSSLWYLWGPVAFEQMLEDQHDCQTGSGREMTEGEMLLKRSIRSLVRLRPKKTTQPRFKTQSLRTSWRRIENDNKNYSSN